MYTLGLFLLSFSLVLVVVFLELPIVGIVYIGMGILVGIPVFFYIKRKGHLPWDLGHWYYEMPIGLPIWLPVWPIWILIIISEIESEEASEEACRARNRRGGE